MNGTKRGRTGMEKERKDQKKNKKTAGNNQWTNANVTTQPDKRERRDGPGGD